MPGVISHGRLKQNSLLCLGVFSYEPPVRRCKHPKMGKRKAVSASSVWEQMRYLKAFDTSSKTTLVCSSKMQHKHLHSGFQEHPLLWPSDVLGRDLHQFTVDGKGKEWRIYFKFYFPHSKFRHLSLLNGSFSLCFLSEYALYHKDL